jgi:predicted NACHT family NTPase
MERGIRASIAGLEDAKKALKLRGWTQEYLAGASDCSRQTVARFLTRKLIEKRIFQALCSALDLEWGTIAALEASEPPDQPPSLDELVETVRVNLYDSIQTKCGSMRVLDMSQPIDLNAIYTTVNILEKITGRRRLEMAELLQNFSLETFERFSLSGVQEARVPGLEAVNKYAKLMILGKPGAGKTTFLKHVALQCIEGAFKPTLVPLFITLKDFAEAPRHPSLLDYFIQLFENYGIAPDIKLRTGLWTALLSGNATPVEVLLRQGKILVLLDGLDEVKEADSGRVLQQIQDFTNQFAKNPFVITCRIAAREYTFERFVEVEVADFDDQQIATFATQWFQAKNDDVKATTFLDKVTANWGIRELATSPLLLTLLCLVFEESGNFPANRSELYKEGLDVLLKKWDVKRNIERDQVYKKLSLKRKEDLLSQIALETFEQEKYFFKQKEAERYIAHYISNLPNASADEETLQLDSEAVLKLIEAQHGLFVERARGIYSFSHLTFHEYFTARKIVTSANADALLHNLATHVIEKRWQEVFLLTVGMLESADGLLQNIKRQIDSILMADENLQQFLHWAAEKAGSVETHYKPVAVRAFYLEFAFAGEGALALARALYFGDRVEFDHRHESDRSLEYALHTAIQVDLESTFDINIDLHLYFYLIIAIAQDLNIDLSVPITVYDNNLYTANPKLQQALQQVQEQLLYPSKLRNLKKWWQTNSQTEIKQLRAIMIEHRNIGHDWRFNEAQKRKLRQYYEANALLVNCLNSDCYVSRAVREEIEASLLLSIADIEKHFPNQRRPQPS